MYFTMTPLILSGAANMLFTKTNLYKMHKHPIDNGRLMWDNRRLFGDNKTWIGFFSMIFFCTLFQLGFGIFCNAASLNAHCDVYSVYENSPSLNLLFGFLTGLIYMVSELPNSFIKRRVGIKEGKTAKGLKGLVFFAVDQVDSLIGVMLLLYFFSDISMAKYFLYVILGAATHIVINIVLYLIKVRENI